MRDIADETEGHAGETVINPDAELLGRALAQVGADLWPRNVNGHEVNACNRAIQIHAGPPGSGGASRRYLIMWPVESSLVLADGRPTASVTAIDLAFQDGEPAVVGNNGLTHEVLLAILIDRLAGFQEGPWACPENGEALEHINAALEALHRRTILRYVRGVEGTHQV